MEGWGTDLSRRTVGLLHERPRGWQEVGPACPEIRPRLLDLFCGAGGAAVGYDRAGFDVTGVDIEPHPDYPFPFICGDAMTILGDAGFLAGFDVIHASPPCPRYSSITPAHRRNDHPDLVGPVRAALEAWGGVYVIENVVGAPLLNPAKLCGSSFGLGVRRHRLFESNVFLMTPECEHVWQGEPWGVYGDHGDRSGRVPKPGGGFRSRKARDRDHAAQVLDLDHITRWDDLTDAIPPAYTQWVGGRLLEAIRS